MEELRWSRHSPVRISAGEHGEPITRASLSHVSGYIEETGSDDDLDLD